MAEPDRFKVAVVTPYYREETSVLRQCHESVAAQTHPCVHFMVADGHPKEEVDGWSCEHITLPQAHDDNGNTPRAIGSLSAISRGFDAIAYLDADNWYRPDHAKTLVELHQRTGADVCTTDRTIHRLDGTEMYRDKENDGEEFVDTSCLFLTRGAFRIVPLWALMPQQMSSLCDRIFWRAILRTKFTRVHNQTPTVAFRTQYSNHYRFFGEEPPEGTKDPDITKESQQWWKDLPDKERRDWRRYMYAGQWL